MSTIGEKLSCYRDRNQSITDWPISLAQCSLTVRQLIPGSFAILREFFFFFFTIQCVCKWKVKSHKTHLQSNRSAWMCRKNWLIVSHLVQGTTRTTIQRYETYCTNISFYMLNSKQKLNNLIRATTAQLNNTFWMCRCFFFCFSSMKYAKTYNELELIRKMYVFMIIMGSRYVHKIILLHTMYSSNFWNKCLCDGGLFSFFSYSYKAYWSH